jgi:hypothetical protein
LLMMIMLLLLLLLINCVAQVHEAIARLEHGFPEARGLQGCPRCC